MQELSEKQKNKLLKLAGLADKGEFAIVEELTALDDKIDITKEELESKIKNIQLKKGDNGRDGKQGNKGDKGDRGSDGKNGEKGAKGDKGDTGLAGKDGKDGANGKDGIDGSPDNAFDIRNKLELLIEDERLDKKAIKGLEGLIDQFTLDRAIGILDQRTSFLINKINSLPTTTGGGSLSSLTAATATNTIDSLNFQQNWQWNTIAGGYGINITSTSTLATGNTQSLINVAVSGTSASAGQTTSALSLSNTKVSGVSGLNAALILDASGATGGNALNAALYARTGTAMFGTLQTSSSAYKVDVNGAARVVGALSISSTAGGNAMVISRQTSDGYLLMVGQASLNGIRMRFNNVASDRFVFGPTGDLTMGGILSGVTNMNITGGYTATGTQTAFGKGFGLYINNGGPYISVRNSAAGSAKAYWGVSGSGDSEFATNGNSSNWASTDIKMKLYSATGNLVLLNGGTFVDSGQQLQIEDTTEQLRIKYNPTNYFSTTVGSTGSTTFDLVGTTPEFTFSDPVNVPDEAYGAGWDGNTEVPTKNALFDKIQSLAGLSWGSAINGATGTGVALALDDSYAASGIGESITIGNTQTQDLIGLKLDTGTSTGRKHLPLKIIYPTSAAASNATAIDSAAISINMGTSSNYGHGIALNITPDNSSGQSLIAMGIGDGNWSGTGIYMDNSTAHTSSISTGKFAYFNFATSRSNIGSYINNPFEISMSRTENRGTGTTADDYPLLKVIRSQTNVTAGGTFTATGSVIYGENVSTQTAGTLTDTVDLLKLVQSSSASATGKLINLVTGSTTIFSIDKSGTVVNGGVVRLKNYTVGTLPAGTLGDTAYVTDALAPAVGVAVAGGGAANAKVWYNGAVWTVTGI